MKPIESRLAPGRVKLAAIDLDPNNPRLFGDRGVTTKVPDARIHEENVQDSVLERLKEGKYGVRELKNSIRQIGFLPIDKIVIRPLSNKQYVVVEGNRRVAALKWLAEDHESGEVSLDEGLVKQISELDLLVLDTNAEQLDEDRWLVQGVRHISGIKEWGLYEKALAIKSMIEDLGFEPREAAEALGTTTNEVNRLYKALGAYEQMASDEDHGENAVPAIFSYFVEAVGKPTLRTWLGWSEEERTFSNGENRSRFYSWIADANDGMKKLPMAIDVRKLSQVVESEHALQVLESEGATLDAAMAALMSTHAIDWRAPVFEAKSALDNIPAADLEKASPEDIQIIEDLIETAERRITQFGKGKA